MSEEEIINQFDKMCVLDENCIGVDCLDEKDLEAIRCLLDLYQQEKEKNKELEKRLEEIELQILEDENY